MEGRSGASAAAPERTKKLSRNEKDRERRRVGGVRHAQALADKQAEIDHLRGSLTGVLGQMENFKGVADIIRDYQKPIQPWGDNEPVNLEECRGCGGQGIRDGMEIARLTAICRKSDCGPLENELVRLRAQIATLEERKADLTEGMGNYESQYALMVKQLAREDEKLEAAEKGNADLHSNNTNLFLKNVELDLKNVELVSGLAWCQCGEHERDYKELDDLNNHERDERAQQDIEQKHRITGLEFEIQLLRDEMAHGPMEGSPVAGFGDDLSAEEQAYQQAKWQHSS
jgi:hypothetical protein